jgi:hypothetical protein
MLSVLSGSSAAPSFAPDSRRAASAPPLPVVPASTDGAPPLPAASRHRPNSWLTNAARVARPQTGADPAPSPNGADRAHFRPAGLVGPGTATVQWDMEANRNPKVKLIGFELYYAKQSDGSPRVDGNPARKTVRINNPVARQFSLSNLQPGAATCFAIKAAYGASVDGTYDRPRPDGTIEQVPFRRGERILSDYNPNESVCKAP